jgi:hypothetical protein
MPTNVGVNVKGDAVDIAYLHWLRHHPEAKSGRTFKLKMPTLDIYSANGSSVYFGDESDKNAAFIRDLPGNLSQSKNSVVRPTVAEGMEMFPELKAKVTALGVGTRYTVFSLSYAVGSLGKEQNEALSELRKKSQRLGIRVIEVRISE